MITGAKWWKFDFHTHTPASHDYGKGPDQATLINISPKEWLLNYMEKEIDCVAVTDHNSGAWVDILNQTILEMENENIEGFRPLHIFPGLEISVHGGIHLLAIFDKNTTSQHISRVLTLAGYNDEFGKTDQTTEKTFAQVVEIITNNNGLAIPAHVDKEAGLFKETSGNTLRQYLKCEGLLSMQVCDLTFTKPTIYNELKMQLTEVAGSDSHRPDQIGTDFTWVKMQKPNLEALKLALHDGEDGVIHSGKGLSNPNNLSTRYFIKHIEVKNSSKAGRGQQPLKINFSPWFSTIIGGRGSGKSSILEFLRIVLNKEEELPTSLQADFEKFKKVSNSRGQTGMLLNDTQIKIELVKDGRDITLVWNNNEITELEKDANGNWNSLGVSTELSKRFPIRLYSQKQLYELTKTPDLLLQLIDNQFDKNTWNQEKLRLEDEWLECRRKIRSLNKNLKREAEINFLLKDTDAKLKLFEDMGHSEVLNEYQKTKNAETSLNLMKENVATKVSSLIGFFDNFQKIDLPLTVTEALDSTSQKILNANLQIWNESIDEYRKLNQKMVDLKNQLDKTILDLPWNEQKNKNEQNYNSFVMKLIEAGETNPQAYEKLLRDKNNLLKELETFTTLNESLQKEKQNLNNIWDSILQHEKFLRDERKKILKLWNEKNDDLRIILSELGDSFNAELTLRKVLRKEGTTFARDICERDDNDNAQRGIVHELYNLHTDIWESRNAVVKKLSKTATDFEEGSYSKKFKEHLNSLNTDSPEDIDKLLVWFPEDHVSLKLKINGKEENIEVGSAGQRTAAMLSLLLSIDDTPLILDQPEDDLDTRRITDLIVKGLRNLKKKQQIIVVTHNPNIPVNGSAEMIIHLNFAGGMIRVNAAGALQDKKVRKAVCDVMEGGSEALSNRYYRIFKALQ
ncbi:MAG: TrlF family AAA-like ATPase [Bacillaceae bacterium]